MDRGSTGFTVLNQRVFTHFPLWPKRWRDIFSPDVKQQFISGTYSLFNLHLLLMNSQTVCQYLMFETLVKLSNKRESCSANWKIILFYQTIITWERLCVFQCTPPQQPTLKSPLTPAIMTRRGIHTWETGTAWTGWRTPMWWVMCPPVWNEIEMKNLFVSFCASNVNRTYLYSFDTLREESDGEQWGGYHWDKICNAGFMCVKGI